MEHYHGYYILHEYDKDFYIIDHEELGLQPTWDIFKATRFETIDDANDWKYEFEQDGYHLEVLFVEINVTKLED